MFETRPPKETYAEGQIRKETYACPKRDPQDYIDDHIRKVTNKYSKRDPQKRPM